MTDEHENKSQINVDWDALLATLEWDDEDRRHADESKQLSLRAAQYAEPTRYDIQSQQNTEAHLIFSLGKERYAVDIAHVRGVQTIHRVTRVPGAPPHYPGVVNMRGRIITVFDLRRFFGLDAHDRTPAQELIQVELGTLSLGILAHHVEEVNTIPSDDIEPMDMLYARGITADKLVVLDLEQLADDDRLVIHETEETG